MEKEKPDVETFAAKIADKQDNPSIHELAKEFPEKTYKELESYRNADRHEEANQIPLTEAQQNLVDHIESAVEKNKTRQAALLTESQKKQEELEPIEEIKKEIKAIGTKSSSNPKQELRPLKQITPDQD